MSRVSAILLAAGLSRRMGRDKLLLPYRGKTLLRRAVDLLAGLLVAEKVLVTSEERLNGLQLPEDIAAMVNPHPQRGQSESIRLGVTAATGDAYLFLAADQPELTPGSVCFLLEAAEANPGKIIVPTAAGVPCGPCLFPALFRAELLGLTGDSGGRGIRDSRPDACLPFPMEFPDCFLDIDTEEDYEKRMMR